MKNETTMTKKLTPAQAYALQVRADRRAAALERASSVIREDNSRVNAMFATVKVTQTKPVKVKRTSKKVRWAATELDLLIELYLKYADPANGVENGKDITEHFLAQYPTRGSSAVNLGIAQIKALDAYYPAAGLKDTSAALVNKLYSIDPTRFPGGATQEEKIVNALDNLLAEIRG